MCQIGPRWVGQVKGKSRVIRGVESYNPNKGRGAPKHTPIPWHICGWHSGKASLRGKKIVHRANSVLFFFVFFSMPAFLFFFSCGQGISMSGFCLNYFVKKVLYFE